MTKIAATTMTTPLGPFTMIGGEDGLVAAGFADSAIELQGQLRHHVDATGAVEMDDLGEFSVAAGRYFAGDVHAIDAISVVHDGSRFQRAAWAALRTIPAGETISYAELARRTRSGSPRAAGTACGRNPVTLFIPCHRVVRSGGDLGGYGWGLERKRWLLAHELANTGRPRPRHSTHGEASVQGLLGLDSIERPRGAA